MQPDTYYMKEINLELSLHTYPKTYPAYLLFNSSVASIFKRALTQALLFGFNTKTRKICFGSGARYGVSFFEINQAVDNVDVTEISEEEFNIRSGIPHWNPIQDAINVLQRFNEAMQELQAAEEKVEHSKIFEEAIEEANKVSQMYNEIFNPSQPGTVLVPDVTLREQE